MIYIVKLNLIQQVVSNNRMRESKAAKESQKAKKEAAALFEKMKLRKERKIQNQQQKKVQHHHQQENAQKQSEVRKCLNLMYKQFVNPQCDILLLTQTQICQELQIQFTNINLKFLSHEDQINKLKQQFTKQAQDYLNNKTQITLLTNQLIQTQQKFKQQAKKIEQQFNILDLLNRNLVQLSEQNKGIKDNHQRQKEQWEKCIHDKVNEIKQAGISNKQLQNQIEQKTSSIQKLEQQIRQHQIQNTKNIVFLERKLKQVEQQRDNVLRKKTSEEMQRKNLQNRIINLEQEVLFHQNEKQENRLKYQQIKDQAGKDQLLMNAIQSQLSQQKKICAEAEWKINQASQTRNALILKIQVLNKEAQNALEERQFLIKNQQKLKIQIQSISSLNNKLLQTIQSLEEQKKITIIDKERIKVEKEELSRQLSKIKYTNTSLSVQIADLTHSIQQFKQKNYQLTLKIQKHHLITQQHINDKAHQIQILTAKFVQKSQLLEKAEEYGLQSKLLLEENAERFKIKDQDLKSKIIQLADAKLKLNTIYQTNEAINSKIESLSIYQSKNQKLTQICQNYEFMIQNLNQSMQQYNRQLAENRQKIDTIIIAHEDQIKIQKSDRLNLQEKLKNLEQTFNNKKVQYSNLLHTKMRQQRQIQEILGKNQFLKKDYQEKILILEQCIKKLGETNQQIKQISNICEQKYESLKQQLQISKAQQNTIKQQLSLLKVDNEKIQIQLKQIQNSCQLKDQYISDVQTLNAKMKKKITALEKSSQTNTKDAEDQIEKRQLQIAKLKNELKSKENDLEKGIKQIKENNSLLQTQIKERDMKIQALQTQIKQRDLKIETVQKQISQRKETLMQNRNELQTQIKERDMKIQALQTQIKQRDLKIETVQKQISQRKETLMQNRNELQTQIKERDMKIQALQTQIKQRDLKIETVQKQISQRKETLMQNRNELQTQIKERDMKIQALQTQIKQRDLKIETVQKQISQRKETLMQNRNELQTQIKERDMKIQALQTQIKQRDLKIETVQKQISQRKDMLNTYILKQVDFQSLIDQKDLKINELIKQLSLIKQSPIVIPNNKIMSSIESLTQELAQSYNKIHELSSQLSYYRQLQNSQANEKYCSNKQKKEQKASYFSFFKR